MIYVTFISNGSKVVAGDDNGNLLRISLRGQGGIPFRCGGGLCGTCKCRIEHGIEHADAVKDKERKHLSQTELEGGYRLACQTFLKGNVSVSWEERKKI